MLHPVDFVVIGTYLVATVALGIRLAGKQTSVDDYFLGGRNLSWWMVSGSVVATETSTLTVIGVPAVAYGGSLTFLQLAIGYIVGRFAVAAILLPRYFDESLETPYGLLASRFGKPVRVAASSTFLVTRLLADGVRLFATAIPLKVIADTSGLDVGYFEIIVVVAGITILYTLVGGLRAVVWMDVVQLVLYVAGAIIAILMISGNLPEMFFDTAASEGKLVVFDFSAAEGIAGILTSPYSFWTAVIGGAFFSVASHGTDHIIVQRLLACRNVGDAKRALIASGFVVFIQFAIFLILGTMLWGFYAGADPSSLGLGRSDEVFPYFVIREMPIGLAGLVLAGILAAAMSTLSSSLSALASSTVYDIIGRSREDEKRGLLTSRIATVVWAAVFVYFASLFETRDNTVVELGLQIAAFTYGGLAGLFCLALLNKSATTVDALVAFAVTIAVQIVVVTGMSYTPEYGWRLALDLSLATDGRTLGWPWYPVVGMLVCTAAGSLIALRHRFSL